MKKLIQKKIFKQVNEIEKDPILRIYGSLLSLVYILCVLYWHQYGFLNIFSKNIEAICWPFFNSCESLRIFSSEQIKLILISMALVAGLNAFLFVKSRRIILPYFILLSLDLLRLTFVLFDYRARLNQHYMIFFMVFTFLFISNKRLFLKWMLISFYFWAGTIKLNQEWISGEVIYGPLWLIPESFKTLATTYVVILELFLIWGLLSRKPLIFWGTLFQLGLFHLESLSVVGFFYPALMVIFLMIFPLDFLNRKLSHGLNFQLANKSLLARTNRAGWSLLIFLAILNLLPRFLPGDTRLTGEGRFYALHMFDAKTSCLSQATIHWSTKQPQILDLRIPSVVRIRCDPIVFLSRMRRLCRQYANNSEVKKIDWLLTGKFSSESEGQVIVDLKDFCKINPKYNIFSHNSWIQTEPTRTRNKL